jgi:hypothetical protein
MSDTDTTDATTIPEGFIEVGEVGLEMVNAVNTMRARANHILVEVGRIESRKLSLLHELNRLESQSQSLLKAEATRMGIPDGSPWQLTPQGKALAPPLGG